MCNRQQKTIESYTTYKQCHYICNKSDRISKGATVCYLSMRPPEPTGNEQLSGGDDGRRQVPGRSPLGYLGEAPAPVHHPLGAAGSATQPGTAVTPSWRPHQSSRPHRH